MREVAAWCCSWVVVAQQQQAAAAAAAGAVVRLLHLSGRDSLLLAHHHHHQSSCGVERSEGSVRLPYPPNSWRHKTSLCRPAEIGRPPTGGTADAATTVCPPTMWLSRNSPAAPGRAAAETLPGPGAAPPCIDPVADPAWRDKSPSAAGRPGGERRRDPGERCRGVSEWGKATQTHSRQADQEDWMRGSPWLLLAASPHLRETRGSRPCAQPQRPTAPPAPP